jgi:hypothetical protein
MTFSAARSTLPRLLNCRLAASPSQLQLAYRRTFASSVQRNSSYPDLKSLWNILPGTDKVTNDKMPSSEPPKHEMAYFKGLATSTRAFGEFRRVLHTGLYSQLVVMEVPVNGEIGTIRNMERM